MKNAKFLTDIFSPKNVLPVLLSLLIFGYIGVILLGSASESYFGAVDSDLVNQFYPWQVFIKRWFDIGVFPFWDPHIFHGYPTVETQQMLALNPVHLLATYLFSPRIALAMQIFIHFIIGYTGMIYLLKRCFSLSCLPAVAGAIAFTLGTLLSLRVAAGHFTVVAAMAWWPWALGTIVKLSRITGSFPYNNIFRSSLRALPLAPELLWGAVFHAMVILAGGPQYIIYLFWMEMAIIAAVAKQPFWTFFRCGVIWVFGTLIAAPQWLPALWYFPYSVRSESSAFTTGLISFTEQRNLLLEFLLPYPFGDDNRQPHLHFKNVWETGTWPGVLALVSSLALFIEWVKQFGRRIIRMAEVRPRGINSIVKSLVPTGFTVAAMSALVLFVLGGYLAWGGWLPGFSGFREPTKARAIIAFASAIAVAAQLQTLLVSPRRNALLLLISTGVLIGAVFTIRSQYGSPEDFVALIKDFGNPFDPLAAPFYNETLSDPVRALARFHYSVRFSYVFLLLGFLLILGFLFRKNLRYPAAAALTITFAVGLLYQNAVHYKSRSPYSSIEIPPTLHAFAQKEIQASRLENAIPWRFVLNPTIINRTHLLDGFYETRGYDPIMPSQANSRQLLYNYGALLPDTSEIMQARYNAVGVRFDVSDWHPGSGSLALTSATLKGYCAEGAILSVSRNLSQDLPDDMIFGPGVNGENYISSHEQARNRFSAEIPRQEEITHHISGITQKVFPSGNESIAYINRNRPDEYGLQLKLSAPAVAILKHTWLPGWQYSINGGPFIPAWCANKWMVAAPVDEKTEKIIFRYRPVFFTPSLIISFCSALFLLSWFALHRTRIKQ